MKTMKKRLLTVLLLAMISSLAYSAPNPPEPVRKTLWVKIVEHWKSWICG